MNIYVGNLSYTATEKELRQAFEAFGAVSNASVIMDKLSGRSRGFGFVEMPNQAEGQKAIEGLNGADLCGRPLRINEARPKSEGGPRGFGGGGGGGFGGGGGGFGGGDGGGGGFGGGGGGGGERRGGGDRRGGGGDRGGRGGDRGGRGGGRDDRY